MGQGDGGEREHIDVMQLPSNFCCVCLSTKVNHDPEEILGSIIAVNPKIAQGQLNVAIPTT